MRLWQLGFLFLLLGVVSGVGVGHSGSMIRKGVWSLQTLSSKCVGIKRF